MTEAKSRLRLYVHSDRETSTTVSVSGVHAKLVETLVLPCFREGVLYLY